MRVSTADPKFWKAIAIGMAGLLVLTIGGIVFANSTKHTPVLPIEISSTLTFSPFVLSKSQEFTASDYKFSTAENNIQILNYVIKTFDGTTITLSEYTQPPEFTEIPEYKDRFLTNVAQQYDTVQTANGTIYLGRLAKQKNRQLGVMLERGLIVFMSPDKPLDKTQWRALGDQLYIQKITN